MTAMADSAAAARIVHVSADYPDAIVPAKTRAIETLVRLVDDRFEQSVISLNRVSPPRRFWRAVAANPLHPQLVVEPQAPDGALTALRYQAPGRGLWHAAMLDRLGDWLADHLAGGPRPGLLVAHKLTVEGIAVARAARALGVPYALTLQGNSDGKILAARPDLARRFARVFHDAAVVFHFAPWTLAQVSARLGVRRGPMVLVPCPIADDTIRAPRAAGDGLVSVFHLANQRIKNLAKMASAARLAARSVPGARLAVVGGGSPTDVAACERAIAGNPCDLEGALPLGEVPARLNRASGFVLASRRESFGLVFIEALYAGCPIAYPANCAVDGLFDGAAFALRVDARDTGAIAEAMARLLRDEAAMKSALAAWQAGDAPAIFRRAAITARFAEGLALALGTAPHRIAA